MTFKFELQRWSFLWLGLALISLGISIFLGYRFITIRNTLLSQAQQNAQKETSAAAQELNKFILMLKPIAQEISEKIGSTPMSKQEIIALIKKTKPAEITGLGVAFKPYAIDSQTKLFSPYYVESDGEEKLVQLTDFYDYTSPEITWFYPIMQEGAKFVEPYYGQATKSILVDYIAPIYRTVNGKKEAIGIVFANQSVEHLNHILDTLFLDNRGYWAMLSEKGNFLAHPQEQLIHKQTSLFDLAKQLNDPGLAQAAEKIVQNKPVFYEYSNEITGAPSWLFSEPLKGTKWSIIGVFDKSELGIDASVLRHNLIIPSLAILLFMLFFTLFIISLFTKNHPARWWLASIIISMTFAGQIVWTWYATYIYPEFHQEKFFVVQNKGSLYDFLKKETAVFRYGQEQKQEHQGLHEHLKQTDADKLKEEALLHGYKNPRYIPTGIFVNSLQFIDANQIQVNGYVWQRYTNGKHDEIPRGITFPQSNDTKLTELSTLKQGNTETMLWEMHAKLDQVLHFRNYPFDTKAIQIQLWHKYTKKNIVLIPDLNAYQLLNPRSLPGIDDDAFLPGWDIVASSFGFKKVNYTSNFGAYSVGPFGVYDSADKSDIPELFFDIFIRRRLIDTLVSDLLPIAVIAVLLFVILLTSTQQKLGVIGSLSGVFFATIFAQIRFRSKIPAAQVVYFESFFFLMYAMILFILVITMAKYLKLRISVIHYRDNLVAKLLYWPILFASLSAITLWYLY